jgi:hypothetical protein
MITSSHLIITAALGKRWPHLWPWRGAALVVMAAPYGNLTLGFALGLLAGFVVVSVIFTQGILWKGLA